MSQIGQTSLQLRQALRRLAKAVAVITTQFDGRRFAMSATAVSELSMDPPSMLICVNQTAALHEPLRSGADFCINILHSSQKDISVGCGGQLQGEARFSRGEWFETALGIPCLRDAQASIICRNQTRLAYGTHSIFIGNVERLIVSGETDPLIYVDGQYTAAESMRNERSTHQSIATAG
jgi:flavin reductase (DIM6/NTAB) family NADH-FMN oxidoreductase RutF